MLPAAGGNLCMEPCVIMAEDMFLWALQMETLVWVSLEHQGWLRLLSWGSRWQQWWWSVGGGVGSCEGFSGCVEGESQTVHVPLLLQVADQLCAKYSKEYGKLCRTNQIGTVNDRVMSWWSKRACCGFLPLPVASG